MNTPYRQYGSASGQMASLVAPLPISRRERHIFQRDKLPPTWITWMEETQSTNRCDHEFNLPHHRILPSTYLTALLAPSCLKWLYTENNKLSLTQQKTRQARAKTNKCVPSHEKGSYEQSGDEYDVGKMTFCIYTPFERHYNVKLQLMVFCGILWMFSKSWDYQKTLNKFWK